MKARVLWGKATKTKLKFSVVLPPPWAVPLFPQWQLEIPVFPKQVPGIGFRKMPSLVI